MITPTRGQRLRRPRSITSPNRVLASACRQRGSKRRKRAGCALRETVRITSRAVRSRARAGSTRAR